MADTLTGGTAFRCPRNTCGPRTRWFRKARSRREPSQVCVNQRLCKNQRTCFEGPFGEVIRATGPMARANPFRWSTRYQDDETDIIMYPHRPYNPSTGRFLSEDPIGERGGLNLYAIVQNDAVSSFDPLGEAPCNTKALAACMASCLATAGKDYVRVQCTMDRNWWTLGLCWKVNCRCITRCTLTQSLTVGKFVMCQYHCPAREGTPYADPMIVVPASEGGPKALNDDGSAK